MDWLYIIFAGVICFGTMIKMLRGDEDSIIYILMVLAVFGMGMLLFPQLFSSI